LNLSTKKLIVGEIITPLKSSKGVGSQRQCQLEKPGVVLCTPEDGRSSQTEMGRIRFETRIAGFLPGHLSHGPATSTARLKQLQRVFPKPATGQPKLRLKKVVKWHKPDHALLALG
jgi:hypothetical protein